MEACDTSVTLGNTVCAPSENAPLCISVTRFGMGASEIASGRSPSMERITTRRAGGAKVGVSVGEGVSVGVAVNVCVAVAVCEAVGVRVGVWVAVDVCEAVGGRKENPGAPGIWQASRTSNEKTKSSVLRREVFMECFYWG